MSARTDRPPPVTVALAAAAAVVAAAALAVVAPRAVPAAEIAGLYEAEVPVAGKSDSDREAALGAALRAVVVKVSGRRAAAGDPVVAEALGAPGRFVQQYQYRAAPADAADPGAARGLLLWARFDPREVDTLLRGAGLPVWGRVRPSVLAWVAVEADGARAIVGGEDPQRLVAALRRGAAQRGIPIVLPLLDLEDRASLDASDVWAGFDERIRAASARYSSEAVLVGRVARPLPTLWEARWTLLLEGSAQRWHDESDAPGLLAEAAMHEAADLLASRYASAGLVAGPARVEVVVSGVQDFAGYARTVDYLGSLDGVTDLRVGSVDADRVALTLDAAGGVEGLRRLVSLGTTLAPDVGAAGAQPAELRLRLLP